MDTEKKSGLGAIVSVIGLVLLVVLYGVFKYVKKDEASVVVIPKNDNTEVVTTPTPVDTTKNSKYKDGTYTAIGSYNSPGGIEQIKVEVTLVNDIITDANVTSLATRPESRINQAKFISGYKALVIGKKIDEIQLGVVSGSSLTPKGFMDALLKIEAQAKI